MGKRLKLLNRSSLFKLTILTSAVSLVSGFSLKSSADSTTNTEAVKSKTNVQKEAVQQKDGEGSSKPNVVFIVLDDSGYSDIGSYGSEIKTPNIDWLAENGLRYNNSHVTPLCSPTRASLLTGRNSHDVGMGLVSQL